jgi:hypothetical protein
MKKLLFVLLLSPIICFGQKPDVSPLQWNEDEIFHQTVLDFPSLKSDQIFNLTKVFLSDAFKNYKEVVNLEDQSLGIISGRGTTTASYSGLISDTWNIHFSFKYEIKDEKVRVTFDNFEFTAETMPRPTSFEFFTYNTLSKKYVPKVTKAQKQICENFGIQLEDMNQKLLESATKPEDW